MAEHTLAILVKAIGAGAAAKQLKGVDSAVAGIGHSAGKGLRTAAGNLAKLGAVGAGVAAGVGVLAINQGIESLDALENATTAVDGAIKQMGETGQVTSGQVAGWANEIEASVQAAFDDKDITRATATLIRFGKVTPQNLRPAMVVMTDLAAKTGDVDSAASLLSKALADPTKAAGKLARQGIILTKAEQAQITAFIKAGKVGAAQKVVLDAVARSTKGAAAAAKGPYADALNEMHDAGEDVTRSLAVGFLPVIQEAASWIKTKMADPNTLQTVRTIGQTLADAAGKVLSFVEQIPWDKVGSGLSAAAGFASTLIGAFTSMPPEVQGTIIALAGLNKLSGGAITGIVSQLGQGLIKGVLGMTAGVVNLKAGVVKGGGGGLPGGSSGAGGAVGAAAGAAEGIAPALAPMSLAAVIGTGAIGATIGVAVRDGFKGVTDWLVGQGIGSQAGADQARRQAFGPIEYLADIPGYVAKTGDAIGQLNTFLSKPHPDFLGDLGKLLAADYHPAGTGPMGAASNQAPVGEHANVPGSDASWSAPIVKAIDPVVKAQNDARAAFEAGQTVISSDVKDTGRDTQTAVRQVDSTTRIGSMSVTAATQTGASQIVTAIHSIPTPITNVSVTVGPNSVTSAQTTQGRAGQVGGSRGNSNDRGK